MARTKTVPTRKRAVEEKLASKPGGEGAAAVGKQRKKYRSKPGRAALREIKRYQKNVDLLIPKLPYRRLVREIAAPWKDGDWRFTRSSFEALQEAGEAYLVELFDDSGNCALQCGQRTVKPKHMKLALAMRHDPYGPAVELETPVLPAQATHTKRKRSKKAGAGAKDGAATSVEEASGAAAGVQSNVAVPPM